MKTMKLLTTISLGVLLLSPTVALSQVGFMAPPSAMDTMSGAGTGAGNFGYAMDRTNAAVGAANNFGAAGDPAGFFGGPSPFDAPATNFNTGAGNTSPGFQRPDTLKAWGGERIICRKTGEILQDGRELNILATATGNYFDDGQNGNDAMAGDNTYTNITINDTDFISPEAHYVKSKIIQTLQFVSPPSQSNQMEDSVEEGLGADLQGVATRSGGLRKYLFSPRKTMSMTYFKNLTPMQFNGVTVATTEPLSPLPKLLDLEKKQDEIIMKVNQDGTVEGWVDTFLRDYFLNPDDYNKGFIQTYMPPPPRAPNVPLPAVFVPDGDGDDEEGGSGGGSGDLFGGSAAGDPMGNASSRYF